MQTKNGCNYHIYKTEYNSLFPIYNYTQQEIMILKELKM